MQKNFSRKFLINEIAKIINQINLTHPVRVAIDGPGNAGKTTFSNELSEVLKKFNRTIIRSTIDGFHHPPEFRRKQGEFSPKGYLEDSHNYSLINEYLLNPLGPNGNLKFKESIYNFKINQPTNAEYKIAFPNSILLFDGIFLFKEQLISNWDYKIYIDASFENTMNRAIIRDSELFGGTENVIKLYKKRYIPGHEMYLSRYNPIGVSDIAINNDDFQTPIVIKISKNNLNQNLLTYFPQLKI